jgi:EmrB/QacA subfamily drug resistance transporter
VTGPVVSGAGGLRADSPQGRWVLLAAVLGSGMALLDGSVVNVALRTMGDDLGASVPQLQWVVNAYLLTLAALILVGGALGDRLGRRRVFTVGVVWFAVASALCALAQTPNQLIVARLVHGVGAALLTPGSLALIQASFQAVDRGRVIGRWAGLGGIAAAVGPSLGGWVVDVASWRWVFWVNIPIAVLVVWVTRRHVPESRDVESPAGYDVVGSLLAVVGLGGVTFALIETTSEYAVPTGVVGAVALALFLVVQTRSAHPVMPLHLYRSRVFSVANAMTLLVYGALGAMTFFLVLQLQVSAAYSPLEAGLATLPITVALLLLSGRAGHLATRIGPRPLMAGGPLVCALGTWLLRGVDEAARYWVDVLPGLAVFSVGLAALVAPLTTSVLAAAPDRFAGVASGVNNAVARTGSLLAVAALPALVGVGGEDYTRPEVFTAGYSEAMLVCTVLLAAGGLVSLVGLTGTRGGASDR